MWTPLEPLYCGHHWNLSIVDTIGTSLLWTPLGPLYCGHHWYRLIIEVSSFQSVLIREVPLFIILLLLTSLISDHPQLNQIVIRVTNAKQHPNNNNNNNNNTITTTINMFSFNYLNHRRVASKYRHSIQCFLILTQTCDTIMQL